MVRPSLELLAGLVGVLSALGLSGLLALVLLPALGPLASLRLVLVLLFVLLASLAVLLLVLSGSLVPLPVLGTLLALRIREVACLLVPALSQLAVLFPTVLLGALSPSHCEAARPPALVARAALLLLRLLRVDRLPSPLLEIGRAHV